jgi:hypothetical protein
VARVDELCFEVGEAPAEKPVVRPCCLELLAEFAGFLGEFTNSAFEGGALDGDSLDGVFGVLGLEVADLAEEDADPVALAADLCVGAFSAASALRARCCHEASSWAS